MDDRQTLKQQLPFPYNQDLSQVLQRLDRRTPFSRAKLANDPVTAAYLAAAMRLVKRRLGPGAERTSVDPEDESSLDRPALSFLSQRAVAAEVANNPDPFHRVGSVATLRSTWRSHSDFIADLLSFGLWSQHYPATYDEEFATGTEQLLESPDFVQAVHSLAYWSLAMAAGMPNFRLELIAAATAEGDDAIRKAMAENYRGALEPWKQIYAAFLKARGLRLRPGVTLDDFTNLLTALREGLALRTLCDPDVELMNYDQRRSLLGTGALALIVGCVERADDAQNLTLEQAVHAIVYVAPKAATGADEDESGNTDG